jgi:hypothetical protein
VKKYASDSAWWFENAVPDWLKPVFEPKKRAKKYLPPQCAEARLARGDETRAEIIRQWRASRLPERERVAHVSNVLGISGARSKGPG